MESLDLLIACIHKLGGEDIEVVQPNTVDFTLRDIRSFAYVQDGGRLRGSVLIDSVAAEDMADAVAFAAQFHPTACRADVGWVSDEDADGGLFRLLFERELDPESIAYDDPLADEAELIAAAVYGEAVYTADLSRRPVRAADPAAQPPTNAWLLIGGDDSYPDAQDIETARRDASLGIYEQSWTTAKQTEPGDLLFFYFTEPRKAVHFVARAVDHAYFEDLGAQGQRWSGRQWWSHITPLIEIHPIPLNELLRVTGDMVMLGRSGRYLRPEHASSLAERVRARWPKNDDALSRVLQPVTGRPDHPRPECIDLAQWRQLTAGSLALEAHVEQLIVEPIVRLALTDHPNLTLSKAYRAGSRIVDYAVLRNDHPICAIEVKLRVRRSRVGAWSECKDFLQASDYSRRLGVPAILMDAFDMHLIRRGDKEPAKTLHRHVFLDHDLETLTQHILGK